MNTFRDPASNVYLGMDTEHKSRRNEQYEEQGDGSKGMKRQGMASKYSPILSQRGVGGRRRLHRAAQAGGSDRVSRAFREPQGVAKRAQSVASESKAGKTKGATHAHSCRQRETNARRPRHPRR